MKSRTVAVTVDKDSLSPEDSYLIDVDIVIVACIIDNTSSSSNNTRKIAPCGSRSCRIDPLRFLAGWRNRRLNQVLVSFGLVCVYVCSFYRLFRFFELTVFGCSFSFDSTCQVIDREDHLRYDNNVLSGTLNFQPTNQLER